MTKAELESLTTQQKAFFHSQKTQDITFREQQLKRLKEALLSYEEKLAAALYDDLHKSPFEVYIETGQVLKEIRFQLKKLRSWSRPRRVKTPLFLAVARSHIIPEPYGRVLIFSPWNYPLLLLLSPLVGAIASGNCITLKPSGRLPALTKVLQEMFSSFFDPAYVALVTGGHEVAEQLLSLSYDYIFFTGSMSVGKHVMKKASETLTPVTLELGGKNPCIVAEDADLSMAARRITWGKFLNAGQSCVAPDFVAVHHSVKNRLIDELVRFTKKDFGEHLEKTKDYTGIISQPALLRLASFMKEGKILIGGKTFPQSRMVQPTILEVDHWASEMMNEEIFGPVLPVIGYASLEEVYQHTRRHPNPLALYLFTRNRHTEKEVYKHIPSGGFVRNDVVIHFSNHHLPLGGKNQSGIGRYHGYYSFETFSHYRAVMRKRIFPDFPFRYFPYTKGKYKLLRKLLK